MPENGAGPLAAVDRLAAAMNRHDLDALVACFAPDYVSEAPAHPGRSFRGSDQVRRNWAQILGSFGDFTAALERRAVDGDTVWAEWEWSGTRPDGGRHVMRGVTILGVRDGLIARARFYMEPVDESAAGVEAAVRAVVAGVPA
ncbi:MAG TPA: nuclear transport factor 2 family protein [Longimicrobiaceae bacterium]|nr:nuclear transport factor 2 family protein [Longimicrobiaceae bacterium]